ncbi:MAG: hypothetical protein ACNS60_04960 [Candidatus Cyclobacteriaceae bacterium M2_1C_046]
MNKLYKIFFILFFLSGSNALIAQQIGNLEGINYQAVAIDEDGQEIVGMDITGKPLFNKSIDVRFTILSGIDGPIYYQEEHNDVITNENGLFSLVIGQGEVTAESTNSTMMEISWIEADQFLKVEIAIEGGGFRLVSLQELMAVPYSFYTDDIADDAITTAKILNEEILAEDINTGAVTSDEILNSTIVNEDIANSTIDLTAKVTGILPVENGGTGTDSLVQSSLLIGSGKDSLRSLGQATDGQIPIGVTGGDPVLGNIAAGTGIIVNNTPGGITISSGVQGVNTQETEPVTVGTILAGTNFVQQVTLQGVAPGDFVVASYSNPLQGCLLSGYVRNNNQIEVAIFNANNTSKNLGTGTFKVLVIK